MIKPLIGTLILVCIMAMSLLAQTGEWPLKSKRAAENVVANQVDALRRSEGLPLLHRVAPTLKQVQLVCTAAVTGKTIRVDEFQTYVTRDLSAITEQLKLVSTGISIYSDGSHVRVYSDKDWPRYSVAVQIVPNSPADHPAYAVAIERRNSSLTETLTPMTFDRPLENSRGWKKQIAPQCTDVRP
ncbi:MAG: hypothetical protein LAO76_11870 [Acidobacteriia bacterium]|nr:hypothetical protein [Terriglobia bacterium]